MSETNKNILGTDVKLVDLEGLSAFWGSVKNYVDNTKDAAIESANGYTDTAVSTFKTDHFDGLATTVEGHTKSIGDLQTIVSDLVGGDDVEGGISGMIDNAINTFNTNTVAPLDERVTTAEGEIDALQEGVAAVDGKISTAIQGMNNDPLGEGVGAGNYVSEVKIGEKGGEDEGKLLVTYSKLPSWTDDVAGALAEAKEYADDQIESAIAAHSAVEDTYVVEDEELKKGLIHVSASDRYNWDLAAARIYTFLTSTETNEAIDNLTEINKWFTDHKGDYGGLLENINDHTTAIGTNTDNIASNLAEINKLKAIVVASTNECANIVTTVAAE
jgi:hypothetical protein